MHYLSSVRLKNNLIHYLPSVYLKKLPDVLFILSLFEK